jgi:hypothetical protein
MGVRFDERKTMRYYVTGLLATLLIAFAAISLASQANATGNGGDCTPAIAAQHYSLKGNSGIGKNDVPLPPSLADYWQANTTHEPHLNNPNVTWYYGTVGVGLHYTSHGSKGLRDWFFFQPEVPGDCPTDTPPPTTEPTTAPPPPPTTEPTTPPTTEPTSEPPTTEPTSEPPTTEPPTSAPPTHAPPTPNPPKQVTPPKQVAPPAAPPTAVDAGL